MNASRAWAEIDLDALAHNLRVLGSRAGPRTAVLLVAKADAYGHGSVAVAHHALRSGARAVAVSNGSEALELRQAGVTGRILVLGAVSGDEVLQILDWDVELGIFSTDLFRLVERTARRRGRRTRVHLKLDTGMNRLGVAPEEALGILESIQRSPTLALAGVMTHLAATEAADAETSRAQLARFDGLLREARARSLVPPDAWIHAANTWALMAGHAPAYNAVRLGVGAYGVSPEPRTRFRELRPVMSVRTRIVHLHDVAPGGRVGYGGTWTATRPARIATLPMGYDDGVAWRLGNRGSVLVRGRRAPIVGRISMDYTTVDVTDVPAAALGDTATLIGTDATAAIRAEELAHEAGTVPYEVLCSIGKRVRRIYRGEPLPSPVASPLPAVTGEGAGTR